MYYTVDVIVIFVNYGFGDILIPWWVESSTFSGQYKKACQSCFPYSIIIATLSLCPCRERESFLTRGRKWMKRVRMRRASAGVAGIQGERQIACWMPAQLIKAPTQTKNHPILSTLTSLQHSLSLSHFSWKERNKKSEKFN